MGGETKKTINFDDSWVSSSLSFLPERLHCYYYIDFHCSYLYSYYNSSQTLCITCWDSSFRAEFQHFILRFNKISLFTDSKRGVRGWKEAQRQGEDRVNLRIPLLYIYDIHECVNNAELNLSYWQHSLCFWTCPGKTHPQLREHLREHHLPMKSSPHSLVDQARAFFHHAKRTTYFEYLLGKQWKIQSESWE
jgi:hypothetical protein